MNFVKYSEKLESMIYFIKSKSACNVLTLSLKLGVSKRTILRMVDALKEKGYKIRYCKKNKSYLLE